MIGVKQKAVSLIKFQGVFGVVTKNVESKLKNTNSVITQSHHFTAVVAAVMSLIAGPLVKGFMTLLVNHEADWFQNEAHTLYVMKPRLLFTDSNLC